MKISVLHIITFDIPYPADYGGVIDAFCMIKDFKSKGVEVILHCFYDKRKKQPHLEKFCKEINYYERNKSPFLIFNKLPFILISRKNDKLFNRLLEDDLPILFHGLNSSFYLKNKELYKRYKILRTHNIDTEYHKSLQKSEANWFKKILFAWEVKKIRNYEKYFDLCDEIWTISEHDFQYHSKITNTKVKLISAYTNYKKVENLLPTKDYILYHGNLENPENDSSAKLLIEKVFSKIDIPCIIAGKNPKNGLIKNIKKYTHIQLIANPSNEKLNDLIQEAKANIIYTERNTGIKLRALNALSQSKNCFIYKPLSLENIEGLYPPLFFNSLEELLTILRD